MIKLKYGCSDPSGSFFEAITSAEPARGGLIVGSAVVIATVIILIIFLMKVN